MRLRFLIPAALAAAATYAALVREEAAPAATWPAAEPPDPRFEAYDTLERYPHPQPQPDPLPSTPVATVVETLDAADAPSSPTGPSTPPSPYGDLAEPQTAGQDAPSVYDLLAGTPPASDAATLDPPDGMTGAVAEEPSTPGAAPASGPAESDPWAEPLEEGRFALGGWAAAAGHSVVSGVTFRRRLPADVAADRIALEIDASENIPDGGLIVMSDPGFAPDRDGFTLLLSAAEAGSFSAAGSYRVLTGTAPSG